MIYLARVNAPIDRARRGLRLLHGGARVLAARAAGGSFPFSMTFILTHRCNFRCEYCNIPDAADREMTTDEFRRALDELAAAGLVRASFSGGEALLRRDARAIIRHARELGLQTSLNSNAWLAQQHIDELADILDLLVVSLDGPEAVHDLVRHRAGSYARVIGTLAAARARGLATATITVLSRQNLHVMDEVIALAVQHGFYAYFQPAYEDCFDHRRGFDPGLDPRIFHDIAGRLRLAHARGEPVGASPRFIERLAAGPRFGDCETCTAGRFWGTVLPEGRLIPCHLTASEPGFVAPSGLELGFAEAFRRLPAHKRGPGCAISPYQETDLIFALDPRAIHAALRRLLGPRSRA
jgi:pyrroloquinoline quinone biosynthesis protein E